MLDTWEGEEGDEGDDGDDGDDGDEGDDDSAELDGDCYELEQSSDRLAWDD